MAEKHSSPDWFARGIAVVGIALSIFGLVLGYLNYRWQRKIQEEATAERILVHLYATRFANGLTSTFISPTPKGEVGMEIVNIGLRPLFIKRAEMRIHDSIFFFYEHDQIPPSDNPTKINEPIRPMKSLEPSEAVTYRVNWDFSKHPLDF